MVHVRFSALGLIAALVFACDRDETPAAASSAPPSPPAPVASAARPPPELQPRKPLAPEITYRVPAGWRKLDVAPGGAVVADFIAREGGPRAQVRVQIQRRTGASGTTPAERVASVEGTTRASFAEVKKESREEYDVAGTRVVVLDLEGIQRREVPSPGGNGVSVSARPQVALAAIVETPGVPYRVFASGSAEGIAEVREPFARLVESLRLGPE